MRFVEGLAWLRAEGRGGARRRAAKHTLTWCQRAWRKRGVTFGLAISERARAGEARERASRASKQGRADGAGGLGNNEPHLNRGEGERARAGGGEERICEIGGKGGEGLFDKLFPNSQPFLFCKRETQARTTTSIHGTRPTAHISILLRGTCASCRSEMRLGLAPSFSRRRRGLASVCCV